MLLSAVSVFVVAQSSSEIPEGLMNNSVVLEFSLRNSTDRNKGTCSVVSAVAPILSNSSFGAF